MPKIAKQLIYAKADDGQEYRSQTPASISAGGDFRVQVPEELREIFENFRQSQGRGNTWDEWQTPGKYGLSYPTYVEAPKLATCMQVLNLAASEHLKCEVVRERFILYTVDVSCAFWRNDDGTLFPCGHYGADVQGRWYEIQSTSQSFHSANRIEDAYRIGLAARAWTRVSYIRPSGTTTKWEHLTPPEGHLGYDTPLQKLQSFCSITIGPDSDHVKTMPYSDAAALWFHDAMLSLFRVAYGLDQFFANPDNLLAIQEGRASVLLSPPPQTRRQFQLQHRPE